MNVNGSFITTMTIFTNNENMKRTDLENKIRNILSRLDLTVEVWNNEIIVLQLDELHEVIDHVINRIENKESTFSILSDNDRTIKVGDFINELKKLEEKHGDDLLIGVTFYQKDDAEYELRGGKLAYIYAYSHLYISEEDLEHSVKTELEIYKKNLIYHIYNYKKVSYAHKSVRDYFNKLHRLSKIKRILK